MNRPMTLTETAEAKQNLTSQITFKAHEVEINRSTRRVYVFAELESMSDIRAALKFAKAQKNVSYNHEASLYGADGKTVEGYDLFIYFSL